MLRKSIPLIAALVLVVSASVLLLRRAGGAHKIVAPAEAAEAATDVARLEAEIASLRYQMGSDRLERSRTVATEPKALEPTEPRIDENAGPSKPHAPVTERQIVAFFDSKFEVETVDPSWSETARATVSRALAPHLPPGSSLGHVECRTNTCRVETTHGSVDQFKEFMQSSFVTRNPELWNGAWSSWVVDPEAPQPVAVSFIAREGQNLPTMPN
jgi:hypothetical protein